MDRKYIDDHHLVARYLADKLADADRTAFESYFLDHPEILPELELAAQFKAGLAHLDARGELAPLLQPQPWYAGKQIMAFAASIAIFLMVLGFWLLPMHKSSTTLSASLSTFADRAGKLPVMKSYTLQRIRGNSYDAEIEAQGPGAAIQLRVLPEIEAPAGHYRVSLVALADNGETVSMGNVAGLAADQDGFVSVFVNSAKLGRGRYRIVLSDDAGTNAAAATSTFSIKVVAPKPG